MDGRSDSDGARKRCLDGRITMRLDNRFNGSWVSCFGCGESSFDNPNGPTLSVPIIYIFAPRVGVPELCCYLK